MTAKYELYEAIAEAGNIEEIKGHIEFFEKSKRRFGMLIESDEEILTMLNNSLNWIRPFDIFRKFGSAIREAQNK